jgi:hypothetical protein
MGFSTILDVIGSTFIGGILLLTLMRLQSNASDNQVTFGHDKTIQSDLAYVAETIENDFRKMGYCADPYEITDTTKLIYKAEINAITFRADINQDSSLDKIEYYIGSTSQMSHTPNPNDRILYKRVNGGLPLKLSYGITSFNLEYFDVFQDTLKLPIADTRKIALIKVSFQIEDPDAYNKKYSKASWSQLRLTGRNLRKR